MRTAKEEMGKLEDLVLVLILALVHHIKSEVLDPALPLAVLVLVPLADPQDPEVALRAETEATEKRNTLHPSQTIV